MAENVIKKDIVPINTMQQQIRIPIILAILLVFLDKLIFLLII